MLLPVGGAQWRAANKLSRRACCLSKAKGSKLQVGEMDL
jgi:hypothetical protein